MIIIKNIQVYIIIPLDIVLHRALLVNVKMPFSWKVGLSIRKSVASCATAGYILTVPDGKQY